MELYWLTYTERVESELEFIDALPEETQTEFKGYESDYDNTFLMWRNIAKENPDYYKVEERFFDTGRECSLIFRGDSGMVITKVLVLEYDA